MIVTCTMNPAIDLFVRTNSFLPKVVNRTLEDDIQPNGKGVNVSFVLKMLGIDNQAIGFTGGFTGEFIKKSLVEKGISTDFVDVTEATRINVFTKVEDQKQEYKLVNQGPTIPKVAFTELLGKISQLTARDLLCVSGSNPKGISDHDLLKLAKLTYERKVPLAIDTSSPILLELLKYRPFCLKPNDEELAALFGKTDLTEKEIHFYGQKLVSLGAKHVIVSLGERGACYFSEELSLQGNAPKGQLVNSACAGDTLLGTFLGLLTKGEDLQTCLKFSIAAASSTAFTEGLTDFSDVLTLSEEIRITQI